MWTLWSWLQAAVVDKTWIKSYKWTELIMKLAAQWEKQPELTSVLCNSPRTEASSSLSLTVSCFCCSAGVKTLRQTHKSNNLSGWTSAELRPAAAFSLRRRSDCYNPPLSFNRHQARPLLHTASGRSFQNKTTSGTNTHYCVRLLTQRTVI